MNRNPIHEARAGLAVAVAAISFSAILIRWSDAPSLGIAFYRLLFATALLAPFGVRRPPRDPGRTLALAAAAGLLLAVHFAAWISSVSLTSVASSVMLVSTQPVFVAILGPVLLGERPGRRGLQGMVLAIAGMAVLVLPDLRGEGHGLRGDALALLGALAGALYLMIGRRLRERIDFLPYLFLVNLACVVCLAGMAAIAGTRLHGYPPATWFYILLMALVPHLMGHGLLNWSVRRVSSFTVNVAVLGEPLLATLYAALLLGEVPPWTFYAGGALIALGIIRAMGEESNGGRAG